MTIRNVILSLCAVTALGMSSAQAAPVAGEIGAVAASKTSNTIDVQYRRYGGRNWGGRGWRYGGGIAAGIVAGAIIADYAYRPRRGYYYDTYDYSGPYYYPADYRGDPRVICARNFKSFEWRTGLYTTYQGEKKLCPYLRD